MKKTEYEIYNRNIERLKEEVLRLQKERDSILIAESGLDVGQNVVANFNYSYIGKEMQIESLSVVKHWSGLFVVGKGPILKKDGSLSQNYGQHAKEITLCGN